MATILESTPGSLVYVKGSLDTALRLHIDGAEFDELSLSSIVTGVRIALEDNVQAVHSLGDMVHIYSFGRKISSLAISGVSVASRCKTSSSWPWMGGGGANTGIDSLIAYYNKYRAGARAEPITVQIGSGDGGLFEGFMHALSIEAGQPESMLVSFAFLFKVLPAKS